MKEFQAHFIPGDIEKIPVSEIAELLDQFPKQQIDNLLWSANAYKPEVYFIIAYSAHSILLKYTVKEQYLRAVYRKTNDPVYKDSCVEAFIAFDNECYYNLEFNSLGTALIGYGPGKEDRVDIKAELVDQIKTYSLLKPANSGSLNVWELTLNIPFTVFEYHNITSLNNRLSKANFYKCGDELPEPHFLSWNNIVHPYPNFHLPQFFGDLKFLQ